jgi:NAD(P)-dependent dehydrogenase (short-subunit alcohol dehydrogenase family)
MLLMSDKKTVLVTGALTGIGKATAAAFAETGANVVVSGRRPEAGEALAAELRGKGGEVVFIAADVRHENEVQHLIDKTVRRFGRLDIAVNNAGADGEMVPFGGVTPESYAHVFDTNVLGTLLSIKHELRVMETQHSGSIVNLSSIYGQKGFPLNSPYVASKHAIIGLTRVAALEGGPQGVRVNAVAPGPVQTAMLDRVTGGSAEAKAQFASTLPLGRLGDPREIADAIVFITSDKAGFLTGEVIFLDGGLMAA